MPESKKRLGTRNPLQLFNNPQLPTVIEPQLAGSEDKNSESGIRNQESRIQNHDLQVNNTEREVIASESRIHNQESVSSIEPKVLKSGIRNPESRIQNHDLQVNNTEREVIAPESRIHNQESRIHNHESRITNPETIISPELQRLYSLSVRIPESLNDVLDDALKQTRRSMGRKIRKEVLVTVAIEAMFAQVETVGGWNAITSEEELRNLLKVKT
jgi:hypothetical protein